MLICFVGCLLIVKTLTQAVTTYRITFRTGKSLCIGGYRIA